MAPGSSGCSSSALSRDPNDAMTSTDTDSLGMGAASPGGDALAMRGEIAQSLFGDVAEPVRIARFEILEQIGAGGMGVVYRARDPKLERAVALKVLNASRVSAQGRARLVREAQTLARLSHPHVVTVYEVGEHEEQVFVAMEFVDGVNVRDWMRSEERSEAEILDVFLAAAKGLAAAHEAGIVHRDFKPANVLLGKDGRVRVADFGLARDDASRDSTRDSDGAPVVGSTSGGPMTKTGSVVGTPAYMAPEQWAGKAASAATDQFSFCVSLWEALTGELPFEQEDVRGAAGGSALPGPRHVDGVRPRMRKALARGMSVRARERWASMGELTDAIEPRRAMAWRGFAVVGLLAAIGGASVASNAESADVLDPCGPVRGRLEKVWSADEQTRLEAAHAGSAPFAAASWGELERGGRAFAAGWEESAAEICDAGGDVDPAALRCLERGVAQFSAFVGRIGEPSAKVVARLPTALATIEDPRQCVAGTLATTVPSPGEGAASLADVSRARGILDEARLAIQLGEVKRADGLISDAMEVARGAEFPPVVAEVHEIRGASLLERGNARDAVLEYREALRIGQQSRHDLAVYKALVGIVRAGALAETEPRESLEPWTDLAQATLERLGSTPSHRLSLDEARLLRLRLSGEQEPALELARDLVERHGVGTTDATRRWARRQQAHLLADSGNRDAADRIYRDLLGQAERRLGPQHPEVAKLHLYLGMLHQQEPKTAVAHFETSLEILRRSIGSEDVGYARAALGLAISKAGLGDFNTSKALAKEATAIQRRLLSDGDPELSGPLILLAEVANIEEDYEAAVGYWISVLDATDPERDADNYAMALNNVGYWYRKQGKLIESESYYQKLRDRVESDSTLHRYASLGLAAYKIRRGLADDARALLVGLDRPSLEGDPGGFALELWPLWALLDGAPQQHWDRWAEAARTQVGGWLVAEVRVSGPEINGG